MASPSQKYLAEDILVDVLYRVPVASLVRCRCVCKTWHHIIGSTTFIKNHLTYQKSSSNTVNKYTLYDDPLLPTLLAGSNSLFDPASKHSKLLYYPTEFRMLHDIKIHGFCNGLLCVSSGEVYGIVNNIHLWNPICRKFKKLPPLHKIFNSYYRQDEHGVSFGYYNDDYKVIVVWPTGETFIVSVYSLETNSWKNIYCTGYHDFERDYYESSLFKVLDTKFVNNTAYVLTSCKFSQWLACFNLSDETMRVVKVPESFIFGSVIVEAFRQTVAIIGHRRPNPGYKYVDMWILNNAKSSSSSALEWKKMFSVELQDHNSFIHPLGFNDDGKLIVRSLNKSNDGGDVIKLYWCDVESPKLMEFKSYTQSIASVFCPQFVELYSHTNCVESLFLLNEEDSMDPYVPMEMKSFCSSMFNLHIGSEEDKKQ